MIRSLRDYVFHQDTLFLKKTRHFVEIKGKNYFFGKKGAIAIF